MSRISADQLASVDAGKFWARVDFDGECWEWRGYRSTHGYGQFYVPAIRQVGLAHRIAYTLTIGEIPRHLEIDHLCRNRSCVNPSHMEPVTQRENVRRGNLKVYCLRGHAATGRSQCQSCSNIRQRAQRDLEKVFAPKQPLGAFQRAKTHCPQGHPYDEINTYVTKAGRRMCRECSRARRRAWGAKQRNLPALANNFLAEVAQGGAES